MRHVIAGAPRLPRTGQTYSARVEKVDIDKTGLTINYRILEPRTRNDENSNARQEAESQTQERKSKAPRKASKQRKAKRSTLIADRSETERLEAPSERRAGRIKQAKIQPDSIVGRVLANRKKARK